MTDLATVTIEVVIAAEDDQDRDAKVDELLDAVGAAPFVLTIKGVSAT